MTHGHMIRLLAVPLLVVAALGGCAGADEKAPPVASAGKGAASSAPAAPADDAAQMRKFAQCMRAEGVDIPDPDASGGIALRAGDADKPGSPEVKKMEAAAEKCRELLPNGGEPPKMSPEDVTKMRAMAKCVRENGVPDFPDPDPASGHFAAMPDHKNLGEAMEKCASVGPDRLPAIRGGTTGGSR
ncbi:hypothetical protein [Jidongwangia harbinensis]|uniref:hypothetical protein n=1 Tax=Jidongwangia harbinensis TaxID=2878561 RepID=UPI001CD9A907|nr:hypothetical protein [Jidongwangia harbinensis]MCA2217599.1 hypothetical protein [Jidongwangia harbinensis]